MNIGQEYLTTVIKRVKYYKDLGEKTFAQLEEKDLHWQPSSESNSIAVIVQHMNGNMLSRWTNFLTEDGEKNWRERDEEFEDVLTTKDAVLNAWNKGWRCVFDAVEGLQPDDVMKTITIRSQDLLVVDAIVRQLDHYGYHVGQIVYIGRMIKDEGWQSLSIPKNKSKAYNDAMN